MSRALRADAAASEYVAGARELGLALELAASEFVWGLASIAQLLRLPFDPALALAASPPPLTFASLAHAVHAMGARGEIASLDARCIETGGGVGHKCDRPGPRAKS